MEVHNSKNPYISILISNYNYQKYVIRCLESCRKQTFNDFEIVIVDDCSTDNSVQIINKYINEHIDLDIKFFRLNSNLGPSGAKDKALSEAKGDYIIIVDADDWMDEDCLETLADTAKKTRADKIRAQVRTYSEDSSKIIRERKIPKKTNKWCEGMFAATLLKREMFTKNNIRYCTDRRVSDDLFLMTLVNKYSEKCEYIRKTVYTISYKSDSDSGINRFNMENKVEYSYMTNNKVFDIYKTLNDKDKVGCEYLFTKQYFFLLLQYSRALSFKDISVYHKNLFNATNTFFPRFYNNANIKLIENGDPFFFRLVMWICCIFERMHIMNPVLKVYWTLSKKVKFVTR